MTLHREEFANAAVTLRALALVALNSLVVSCATSDPKGSLTTEPRAAGGGASSGGAAGAAGAATGAAGLSGPELQLGPQERDDFKAPILQASVPSDAPQLFDRPDGGLAGPCLYDPQLGSLFPSNWLRPRFQFSSQGTDNLFEIRLTIPNQKSPLVVYTKDTEWMMDAATWQLVLAAATGREVGVRIRSANYDGTKLTAGPSLGSEGTIEIAPVSAPGSIVYWTTSGGTVLKGFKVGDENVAEVLKPSQIGTQCVGCHASTPDGNYVAFAARDDLQAGSLGDSDRIGIRALDGKLTEPSFLTPASKALLARPGQEAAVYSKAHWRSGDRTQVALLFQAGKWELSWTDLEAKSQAPNDGWGILARNGDSGSVGLASFSHDGTQLAYCSAPVVGGGAQVDDGDVYTVEYGNRAGGAARPVPGASEASFNEYYPVFSPDDRFLAFNRVPTGDTSYNNRGAELYVVPSVGGSALRLAANDPAACTSSTSPGITNSWPRWAPKTAVSGGKEYYFIAFSSTRHPNSRGPQIYMAPLVVSGGNTKVYPALYFWNQPQTENNHTPAWDSFELAQVPR